MKKDGLWLGTLFFLGWLSDLIFGFFLIFDWFFDKILVLGGLKSGCFWKHLKTGILDMVCDRNSSVLSALFDKLSIQISSWNLRFQ